MRWFASLLGWRGLWLGWVRFSDDEAKRYTGIPESRILMHYVTNEEEFHIQINELPGAQRHYNATMGPFRYGVGPIHRAIGWHRFQLFEDDAKLIAEANRLKPFLDRQQFRDPVRRAAWKKAHPEFVLRKRRRRCPT